MGGTISAESASTSTSSKPGAEAFVKASFSTSIGISAAAGAKTCSITSWCPSAILEIFASSCIISSIASSAMEPSTSACDSSIPSLCRSAATEPPASAWVVSSIASKVEVEKMGLQHTPRCCFY